MSLDAEAAVASGPVTMRFRRWLSVLVGLAAVSATVLSLVESDAGRQEEKALVQANRLSLEIFVKIAASSPRSQFQGDALRRSAQRRIEPVAQVLAAREGEPFDLAVALSRVEETTGNRSNAIAQAMATLPPSARGVDQAILEALNTQVIDLPPIVEEQNAAVDRAALYGTRQERSMFGLALVAIAASLLGLAGLTGSSRAGRISLVTAGTTLTVSVVAGLSGFVL